MLIPEILSNVFSSMTKGQLYTMTLVCKSWSGLSLNELWREMDTVLPLLKVLGPMIEDEDEDEEGMWVSQSEGSFWAAVDINLHALQ